LRRLTQIPRRSGSALRRFLFFPLESMVTQSRSGAEAAQGSAEAAQEAAQGGILAAQAAPLPRLFNDIKHLTMPNSY
jgi:hypothetical protein